MTEELALARSVWYDFLASLFSYPFSLEDFQSRLAQKVEQVAEAAEILRQEAGYDLEPREAFENIRAVEGYPELTDYQAEYVSRLDKPSTGNSLSPFESVHRLGHMDPPTAKELERLYQRYGVSLVEGAPETADHAMVELAFLSFLAAREAEAWSKGQVPEAESLRNAQADFLKDHVLRWMPEWLGLLGEAAEHPLLREAAELGRATLEQEAETIGVNV